MIKVVGSEASSQFLPLGVGKSVVIDLPRDVKDVLVGDPTFANAVIRSTRRAYIIGVSLALTFLIGMTRIYLGVHYPSDVAAGVLLGLAMGSVAR